MKKAFTILSSIVLSTSLFALSATELRFQELEKKISLLEKKQKKQTKNLSKVKKLASKDNIKFDVDLRTSYDALSFKTADGKTHTKDALFMNRLWLGMGYAPLSNMLFKGQMEYNKAYGSNYDNSFINQEISNDALKIREAYWLWTPTTGSVGWSFSLGRRPGTSGYLINLRDDDKHKSAVGHIINQQFDGFSASIKLDKYVSGMYFKLCAASGFSDLNAIEDEILKDTKILGFVFKIYDDAQYSLVSSYYRAYDASGVYGVDNNSSTPNNTQNSGEVDGGVLSFKVDGIGDEINDFLDDTILFASIAMTKTNPLDGVQMLGSEESKSGYSYWIGAQVPNLSGGNFGVEYNHGSKYWRPFTYNEDTMIGSKMAVRGSAYEAYWTQPLIKRVFSMQVRYTFIDYDYTGSNAFFGDGGAPMKLSEAKAAGLDPVANASDLRVYFRYRY